MRFSSRLKEYNLPSRLAYLLLFLVVHEDELFLFPSRFWQLPLHADKLLLFPVTKKTFC